MIDRWLHINKKRGKRDDVLWSFCPFYRHWRIHMHLFVRMGTLAKYFYEEKRHDTQEEEKKKNATIHTIQEISSSQ